MRGGGHGDHGIRMSVIDVLGRDERMQRRVDRRWAGVQVESAMMVHRDHIVLGRRLESFVRALGVKSLKAQKFLLVKRGEVFPGGCAQIAARTFDPENLDRLAGQRVLLVNFGRGVAATGIGDALVGAELVGAIDEAVQAEESSRFLIVPEIEDVVVGFLSHKDA